MSISRAGLFATASELQDQIKPSRRNRWNNFYTHCCFCHLVFRLVLIFFHYHQGGKCLNYEIWFSLECNLTTSHLVDFAMSFGDMSLRPLLHLHVSSPHPYSSAGGNVCVYQYVPLNHVEPDNYGLWARRPFYRYVFLPSPLKFFWCSHWGDGNIIANPFESWIAKPNQHNSENFAVSRIKLCTSSRRLVLFASSAGVFNWWVENWVVVVVQKGLAH